MVLVPPAVRFANSTPMHDRRIATSVSGTFVTLRSSRRRFAGGRLRRFEAGPVNVGCWQIVLQKSLAEDLFASVDSRRCLLNQWEVWNSKLG
jgi:hypothetical protein